MEPQLALEPKSHLHLPLEGTCPAEKISVIKATKASDCSVAC